MLSSPGSLSVFFLIFEYTKGSMLLGVFDGIFGSDVGRNVSFNVDVPSYIGCEVKW